MLPMPLGRILVGFRQREHAGFTENAACEGEAGRVAFLVEAVRNDAVESPHVGRPLLLP